MSLQNSLSKTFNKMKSAVFTRYADNTDKFLMDTAAIGWILASLANMTGVFFNKKLDKKQRKYIAAQELADGVTNVALFYGLTNTMIKGGRKLVDKGIIGSKNLDEKGVKMLRNGVGTIASLAGAVITNNILTPIIRNKFATKIQKKNKERGINPEDVVVRPSSIPYTSGHKPFSIYNYANYSKMGGNLKI